MSTRSRYGDSWTEWLADRDGNVERFVPAIGWYAPAEVELVPDPHLGCGPILIFRSLDTSTDWDEARERRPKPGLLTRFANLADASDERIHSFARIWGELALPGMVKPRNATALHYPVDGPPLVWEPLQRWRILAQDVQRVLRVTSHLRSGTMLDEADERIIAGLHEEATGYPPISMSHTIHYYITNVVNDWVLTSQLRPFLRVDTLQFAMYTRTLGAAIALQLVLAVGGGQSFAACAWCGELFTPQRRPARGKRTICPRCLTEDPKIPARLAQRDYAQRQQTGAPPRFPRKRDNVDSHPDSQEE